MQNYLYGKKHYFFLLIVCFLFTNYGVAQDQTKENDQELKLYWLIPDGMRAEPDLFNIYQWADQGLLPNIKKMMQQGSYGFSIPVFPSHTPTNFATLFTGTYPTKHGVADGPMHVEGNPLNRVSVGGFNSAAKKIAPIWVTMEKEYQKNVILLAIPGSTPPELEKGMTIRGRWGGWGADFHAINFEKMVNQKKRYNHGRGSRLFFFGPYLTQYVNSVESEKWQNISNSYSTVQEALLEGYGNKIYAAIYDSTNNNKTDYDKIAFSFDKKEIVANLIDGQWSDWLPIDLIWRVNEKEIGVPSYFKIKIIKLDENGFFKIRFFFNNLNEHIVKPSFGAKQILDNVGPMVDFVDNFPPQLIYIPEDKKTFIEEANMSLDWHIDAASYILEQYQPDVFIQDTYTPNQMLTSRWWLGYIDPASKVYNSIKDEQRDVLWKEVKDLYVKLDKNLGVLLEKADDKTVVVLSSDHGAIPLNKWVRLNNYFAKKGWLHFTLDQMTGEPKIDWKKTKVIYLKMIGVYINPQGLAGNWIRASGDEYEKLRNEVKQALQELTDPQTGEKPVIAIKKWEESPDFFSLPVDRIGDLVIANKGGYGWNEEMTEDKKVFDVALKTGYKQAVFAKKEKGMWTPFMIIGPGVKKGHFIQKPLNHVDQYPTIFKLLNKPIPDNVDGFVVDEILD